MGIPCHRISVVTNGVSLDSSIGERETSEGARLLGKNDGSPILVFVGRLVPNKNQAALIDMMPTVLSEHPQARLWLVGEGPSEGALRDQIRRLGMEHAVLLAGYVADVPSIVARASVFVTASVSEGISLAVLEAMAAGVPVVATRCTGNEEVLSEGAGLLVDDPSPSALAAVVSQILSDRTLAARVATAGRQRVVERYGFDRMLGQLVAIYDELTQSPAPAE
jgi:glycosyltransferase involved in cell wall biosynthesis